MLLFDNGVRELRLLSFLTSFGGAKVRLWLGQCLPTKRPTWDGLAGRGNEATKEVIFVLHHGVACE